MLSKIRLTMKVVLRKIEPYESKKFSKTLKCQRDYTELLLEITRKLLNNYDAIDKPTLARAYIKLVIDKQSRLFVYLSSDKYYSFEYSISVEVDIFTKAVNSIHTTTGINCTPDLISNAISILSEVKSNSIIDVYESRDNEDEDNPIDIEAYKLLEYFWAHEPCYLRYDYDPLNSKGALHPVNHLDINISMNGSYKIGLKSRLTPTEFEDIVNKNTDCYYLLDKLPSHLLDLKASKKRKKMRKKK